jgi:serine/threonine protein kinase
LAVHVLPSPGLDDETLAPGTMLGRYKIVRRIALGGMAELYLAYATGLDGFEKLVAIKRVQPAFAIDPDFVTMFLDEARTAATLSHPNIAQVHDVGVDGHSYFLAMEFVDGRDVRHLLRESIGRDQRMPLPIAIAIAGAVAAGLHAAHENRAPDRTPLHIVHRDVSPGNVLVTFGGAVKLIDFGIAKAARRRTVTQAGQLKGKAGYMSPEQCTGGTVDRRSDIFSLGVMLYELTTTTRLYRGRDEYQIMRRIVHGAVKPPALVVPGYPAELERIVLRALARDPEARYQTARDLHLELVRFARANAMEANEYDLAAYVHELIPDEQAESVLDIALDDLEDSDVGAEPALPALPALAARAARAASMADTTIAMPADDALHTTIYVADQPEAEPPALAPVIVHAAPRLGFTAALAVLVLAAMLFAGGWWVAEVVCG